jgi:hypothetical protein
MVLRIPFDRNFFPATPYLQPSRCRIKGDPKITVFGREELILHAAGHRDKPCFHASAGVASPASLSATGARGCNEIYHLEASSLSFHAGVSFIHAQK